MSVDQRVENEPSMTQLVSGIVGDVQEILVNQMALLRHEVKEDFRRTRDASLAVVLGLAILGLGSVLLCLTVVYLLEWAFESLPLWGAFAIVGIPIAIAGGVLLSSGLAELRSFNPLPDETATAVKETFQGVSAGASSRNGLR
jgi:hypothetical protein